MLEALEAVLPEDAPPGHEAWRKVQYRISNDPGRSPFAHFTIGSHRFQATLSSCITEQALLRMTRACYVRALDGQPKESVLEFRNQIFKRIKEIKTGGDGDAPAEPSRKKMRTLVETGSPHVVPPTAGAEEGTDAAASGATPSRAPVVRATAAAAAAAAIGASAPTAREPCAPEVHWPCAAPPSSSSSSGG